LAQPADNILDRRFASKFSAGKFFIPEIVEAGYLEESTATGLLSW